MGRDAGGTDDCTRMHGRELPYAVDQQASGAFETRQPLDPPKDRQADPAAPLQIFIRNRLKYALTGREVTLIVKQRLVKVDNKVRTDETYPAGFMGELGSRLAAGSGAAR